MPQSHLSSSHPVRQGALHGEVGSDRQPRPDQKPKPFWLLATGQVQRAMMSEGLTGLTVCLEVLESTEGVGFM